MSLTIRRLRNVFAAGRDLPRAEEVCARIESSVRREGVEQLARILDEALDPADPSVWIIRRLAVSFVIGELAQGERVWARGIALGIRRRIELGPDSGNALRFPDRATYWAWYLRDRAAGTASHWWYEPLDSLRHLDFGAACVTLLSRQADLAAPVLALLDEWGVWEQAVRQLSGPQAARMLDWIGEAEESPAGELLEAAAGLWDWAACTGREPVKARLSAAVRLRRRFTGAPAGAIRGAVETIAEAEAAFRSMTWEHWVRVVAAEWSTARASPAPGAVPARVRNLLRLVSRQSVDELVRGWQSRTEVQKAVSPALESTEFGGWFLLLPFYISLEADALVEESERPALRWQLARMCMGPRGRNAPRDDAGLLWAAGLERPPEELPWPRVEGPWQEEPAEADREYFGREPVELAWGPVAATLVRKFARRLPGFGNSSPAHLDANIFRGRASIELSPGHVQVSLERRPLDILLRMGGLDGESYLLPWRDYATVTIRLV